MKIYVASSWRNNYQQMVVNALRIAGHEVYDFRHPKEGDDGFHWSEIDSNWQNWTPNEYKEALNHPVAGRGYKNDKDAMDWADACVLVLPCGRSAHFEAGWFTGKGKLTYILMLQKEEPELMYKLGDGVYTSLEDLLLALDKNT